jgi:hypothetical protein
MNKFKPTERVTVGISLARTPIGIHALAFEAAGKESANNLALAL